jgi:hypothetical protein
MLGSSAAGAENISDAVPRWEPHDFTFQCPVEQLDPFRVVLTADLVGPDGTKLVLLGFYDGGHNWKVRAAATSRGLWSLTTHSDVAALNGQH